MENGKGEFTMTEIGTEINGKDLERTIDCLYIYVLCPQCGKPKWMRKSSYKRGVNLLCRSCGGAQGMMNRGRYGRKKCHEGYIRVVVHPLDPLRVMCGKTAWCFEHRLVMARHLGRALLPSEFVHHINGIKDDNRIENLELISKSSHSIKNKLCAHCELRKEIRLLHWQIKELQEQVTNLTKERFV